MRVIQVMLLLIGIWIGLIVGLSFIEAPLKFQAPGITVKLGLGIGRIVFNTLNKIELFFSLFLAFLYFVNRTEIQISSVPIPILLLIIVLFQTLILLPALNTRVTQILAGEVLSKSYHHLLYVICEVSKILLLFIAFFINYPK